MFQFPSCPSLTRGRVITRAGLPHSEIGRSLRACRSLPRIVAWHVLPRHVAPRHSPAALRIFSALPRCTRHASLHPDARSLGPQVKRKHTTPTAWKRTYAHLTKQPHTLHARDRSPGPTDATLLQEIVAHALLPHVMSFALPVRLQN